MDQVGFKLGQLGPNSPSATEITGSKPTPARNQQGMEKNILSELGRRVDFLLSARQDMNLNAV
jgi:hypothetical protein